MQQQLRSSQRPWSKSLHRCSTVAVSESILCIHCWLLLHVQILKFKKKSYKSCQACHPSLAWDRFQHLARTGKTAVGTFCEHYPVWCKKVSKENSSAPSWWAKKSADFSICQLNKSQPSISYQNTVPWNTSIPACPTAPLTKRIGNGVRAWLCLRRIWLRFRKPGPEPEVQAHSLGDKGL